VTATRDPSPKGFAAWRYKYGRTVVYVAAILAVAWMLCRVT
jgi:hypothetical protein